MALRGEASRLTQAHYRRQLRARAAALARLAHLIANQDPDYVVKSWAAFEAGIASIIEEGAATSSALAADYYTDFRQAEGINGRFIPRLVLPARNYVTTTLRSTTLATAIKVGAQTAGGGSAPVALLRAAAPVAGATVLTATAGVATRMILNAGRHTILDGIDEDDQALGYARVAARNPCSFCSMLCSRGPVYKSEQTALRNSRGARYHWHCSCSAEPMYSRDADWPSDGRAWREIWDRTTAGTETPTEARIAFRHAVEAGVHP